MKLDDPVAFFLKHESQIREWANLEKRVQALADRFFSSFAPDIERLALELSLKWGFEDSAWPKYRLWPVSWEYKEPGDGGVAIGLEWRRGKADFKHACMGVICRDSSRFGGSIRAALAPLRKKGRYNQSEWWPIWRYEPPSNPKYWADLDGFKAELIGRLKALYLEVSPFISEVVRAGAGEGLG